MRLEDQNEQRYALHHSSATLDGGSIRLYRQFVAGRSGTVWAAVPTGAVSSFSPYERRFNEYVLGVVVSRTANTEQR